MAIELFHRGRFQKVKTATITDQNHNTYSISIDVDELEHLLRQTIEIDTLDGFIFVIEEQETQHVIGHKRTKTQLHITALVL